MPTVAYTDSNQGGIGTMCRCRLFYCPNCNKLQRYRLSACLRVSQAGQTCGQVYREKRVGAPCSPCVERQRRIQESLRRHGIETASIMIRTGTVKIRITLRRCGCRFSRYRNALMKRLAAKAQRYCSPNSTFRQRLRGLFASEPQQDWPLRPSKGHTQRYTTL